MKTYLFDTNVIVHDPKAMLNFDEHKVIICGEVLQELDKLKNKKFNAREFFRIVENTDLEEENIKLGMPKDMDYSSHYMDILIIKKAVANNAILVSKDRMVRVLGQQAGVKTENYQNDAVDEIYSGHRIINKSSQFINDIYKEGQIKAEDDYIENEFINFKSKDQSILTRYTNGTLKIINDYYPQSISARNREQTYALDALMDTSIELVALTGYAGTGKTLLSLAAALEQTMEKSKYDKVNVARPITIMGDNEIGYLPGDKDEKLDLFMQPIYDSIETLYDDIDPREIIAEYKDRNIFNLESIGHIRGRSMDNQFVIVDEVQNLTPHEITTILTRIGENTKVILNGDVNQIDEPYLDKKSNGLAYVIEKFKGEDNFAHIELIESERSRLAAQAVELL